MDLSRPGAAGFRIAHELFDIKASRGCKSNNKAILYRIKDAPHIITKHNHLETAVAEDDSLGLLQSLGSLTFLLIDTRGVTAPTLVLKHPWGAEASPWCTTAAAQPATGSQK